MKKAILLIWALVLAQAALAQDMDTRGIICEFFSRWLQM